MTCTLSRGAVARAAVALLAAASLAACVVPPPPPVPYVAVPGPGKTQAQFQQDDGFCRTNMAQFAMRAPPAQQGAVAPGGTAQALDAAAPIEPPGVAYLRCMTAHGDAVQPLPAAPPPLYAYFSSYPLYVGGYGDYYPWLYGGPFFGFGFGYGGFYGGRGYGYGYGFHGGYGGFRGEYGGFRGGEGGFRGGGGFRR